MSNVRGTLLYDITPKETATLDVRKLAEKVVASWKYEKKDKLALEVRKSVTENYVRQFV